MFKQHGASKVPIQGIFHIQHGLHVLLHTTANIFNVLNLQSWHVEHMFDYLVLISEKTKGLLGLTSSLEGDGLIPSFIIKGKYDCFSLYWSWNHISVEKA